MREHKLLFAKLWRRFEGVAAKCLDVGGVIVVEWPRRCDYWKEPRVQAFLAKHHLCSHVFDGCQYGVTSIRKGLEEVPIRKPWRIATNSEAFAAKFAMARISMPNARALAQKQQKTTLRTW